MRQVVTFLIAIVLVLTAVPVPLAAQGGAIRLPGLTGGQLTQEDLGQGVVIVVVWATWSPRSRDIVPRVNSIVDRWGDQARVDMIDFQEDAPTVKKFLAGKNPKAKVYLDEDGAFSKKYSVTHLPSMLIFKDGNKSFSGKLPNDPHTLISQTIN